MTRNHLLAKVRIGLLLLALVAGSTSLESCRGRRGRHRAKTSWRSRQGTSGAVAGSPLSDTDMPKVVATARSYTGTPYLTGGTTRVGMDCSGLVLVSYQAVNKTVPRISWQQAEAGPPVSENDLQPGDLVFFTDHKGNSKITHVGMVTEVRGHDTIKFIHTTNSLGVVENNLKQNYWHNLYVKSVRIR